MRRNMSIRSCVEGAAQRASDTAFGQLNTRALWTARRGRSRALPSFTNQLATECRRAAGSFMPMGGKLDGHRRDGLYGTQVHKVTPTAIRSQWRVTSRTHQKALLGCSCPARVDPHKGPEVGNSYNTYERFSFTTAVGLRLNAVRPSTPAGAQTLARYGVNLQIYGDSCSAVVRDAT